MIDPEYWDERWLKNNIGWDIGYASPPLMDYLKSLTDHSMRILIPGSGSGYEASKAFHLGFRNVYYNDISPAAAKRFRQRFPAFPEDQILVQDLFTLHGTYDLILEQTSFCAQPPGLREDYITKIHKLLRPDGCMAGVLFNIHFPFEGPPYGGDKEQYITLFSDKFEIIKMDICYNSIIPRQEKELFVLLHSK